MIFAQIKDGTIKNIIILDDISQEANLLIGYDYLKQIDNLINSNGEQEYPSINWLYNSDLKIYTDPDDSNHFILE